MKTRQTVFYSIFAVLLALAFTACATKPEAYQDIDYAIQSNDFEAGIEAIKKGQAGKKPLYDEKNIVSLYLDKGLLEHYAGNYANSSADLQQAERLIEEAFTKSVTQGIASYIANDNTKEYPGEDFEDIYSNVFNALNYYNKGDLEGALVEIRKLTWTNGKLDMLGRKYEGAKASAGEYVLEQLGKIGLKINPDLPQGDSVNFADSVLSRYLGALFYLGNGNADSARIEFERLRAAHAANPNVYYHPFPESAMAARNVPQGKARLNVIGFAGLSPVKEEGVFVSAFPFFQNAVLRIPEFKLPKFVKRPNRIDRIEVVVEGADAFNLELIEDMGAVAEETYNARFGSLFFKTYIRTLLKYAAVDVAAVAAGKTPGGSLAQTAAVVAGKKVADATERADIRMSRYFPGKAYIGGVNLDPGSYTVAVRYYQGSNVIATEERRIDVKAGALNLLETINLGGGVAGGSDSSGDSSSSSSSGSSAGGISATSTVPAVPVHIVGPYTVEKCDRAVWRDESRGSAFVVIGEGDILTDDMFVRVDRGSLVLTNESTTVTIPAGKAGRIAGLVAPTPAPPTQTPTASTGTTTTPAPPTQTPTASTGTTTTPAPLTQTPTASTGTTTSAVPAVLVRIAGPYTVEKCDRAVWRDESRGSAFVVIGEGDILTDDMFIRVDRGFLVLTNGSTTITIPTGRTGRIADLVTQR